MYIISFSFYFLSTTSMWPRGAHNVVFISHTNLSLSLSQLVPQGKQEEIRRMCSDYFASVSDHLQRQHRDMHRRERRNIQMLQSRGELVEERKAANENAQKIYDKLLTNTNTLAVS